MNPTYIHPQDHPALICLSDEQADQLLGRVMSGEADQLLTTESGALAQLGHVVLVEAEGLWVESHRSREAAEQRYHTLAWQMFGRLGPSSLVESDGLWRFEFDGRFTRVYELASDNLRELAETDWFEDRRDFEDWCGEWISQHRF